MNHLSIDEKQKLKGFATSYARLRDEIKALREDQKGLEEKCWEQCGVQGKVLKQLAKEKDWGDVERLAQEQLEDQLHQGRLALGLLADLPLGKHALNESANGAARVQHRSPRKGNKQEKRAREPVA